MLREWLRRLLMRRKLVCLHCDWSVRWPYDEEAKGYAWGEMLTHERKCERSPLVRDLAVLQASIETVKRVAFRAGFAAHPDAEAPAFRWSFDLSQSIANDREPSAWDAWAKARTLAAVDPVGGAPASASDPARQEKERS